MYKRVKVVEEIVARGKIIRNNPIIIMDKKLFPNLTVFVKRETKHLLPP
jgi:hypothetical protein